MGRVKTTRAIDYVNYAANMGGRHHRMYDGEKLVHVLRKAGFKDAAVREFDPDVDISERKTRDFSLKQ
ncbi:MAG: hypothetical protein HQL30_12985 [Candidatus Omnitrophica bacterium]|nr:hypothetical protein [Candidatus Omnitrophota bacterium]